MENTLFRHHSVFFFNDTATTEIYTLSLHDALPIWIPDGHSLIVGGFYGQVKSKKNTKVPFLGDLPWINFFFKSKEASKETTSLVFVVTPTSYDPSSVAKSCETSKWIRDNLSIKPGHDWIEDSLPGPAHLPDLDRTLKDLRPGQRDHQPSVQELRADLKGCCGSAKSGIRHGRRGIDRKGVE